MMPFGNAGLQPRSLANDERGSPPRPTNLSSGRGTQHFFSAARLHVIVSFVPAYRALQGCRHRSGFKTEFSRSSRAVHKHHVPSDFHALDRNLRFSSNEPRKRSIDIGYTQSEAMRNLEAGSGQTGDFGQRV